MEQIIKKSDDRDDKFRNWAKDFNNNEVIKIYKKALIGDANLNIKWVYYQFQILLTWI